MDQAGKSSGVSSAEVAGEDDPESVRLTVKLSPRQRLAIEGFRANGGTAEAARRANCDPSTVSRWLSHDAKFIAAHNAVILENVRSSHAEMASLLPLATIAIRKQLEKANGWLGLQFYREARALGLLEVGPTTAAEVKKELKLAQQNQENELLKKQMQIEAQQQEIARLREQAEQRANSKQLDEMQDKDFWDAFSSFKSIWDTETAEMEREQREAQEELAAAQEPPKAVAISRRPTLDVQIRQKLYSLKYERMCEVSRTLPTKEQREVRLRQIREETLRRRAETFPDDPPPDYLRRAEPRPSETDRNKTDMTKTVSRKPRADDEQSEAEPHQSDEQRADAEQQPGLHRPEDDPGKSNPDIAPATLQTVARDNPSDAVSVARDTDMKPDDDPDEEDPDEEDDAQR